MSESDDSMDYFDRKDEARRQRSREAREKKAEIGPLPAVVDSERKEACRTDLLKFLIEYFPNSTGLKPFSDDHKRMIARLQRCILFGGLMAEAVYRGFAKTTIGENACVWAAVYGHRKYITLIGGDTEASISNLESIKSELEDNDLLYGDFPEVCHAIRALEGKTQRAASQTLDGQPTHLGWKAEKIIFPTVPGSAASGVCIHPQSLMAFSRGMKHKMPDGRQVRPDFAFIDDPQTDESAMSAGQTEKRMSKIKRSILKSAGHSGSIAAYMAATIIEKDDLVDQILDPAKNPAWQGERVKMVRKWPDAHETFWLTKYAETRHTWDRANPDDKKRAARDAMLLYANNRELADAGGQVSWEHCYSDRDDDYEISAIQHAYNMLIDDGPEVFEAECQNEPPDRTQMGDDRITPDHVMVRAVGPERGVVPVWAEKLTAFIDVQGNHLWWLVAAWTGDFTGCIVDYGTFPEQNRAYFTKSTVKNTFADLFPGAGPEGATRSALDRLALRILGNPWKREDDTTMDVGLCLVDEGHLTSTIYEFCRRSTYSARLMPAKGMAIGAKSKPFEEYQKRPGETLGTHWRRVKVGSASVFHLIHDPNHWKSFIWNRLRVPVGDRESLIIHKAKGEYHRMLADHVAASEFPVLVEANGRVVHEWEQRPNRDNDLLDCLSGAAIAASYLGSGLQTARTPRSNAKRKRRATGSWAK